MKATGIVRNLDDLNRLVIPKEIVKTQNLEGAPMEIFNGPNGEIILSKYQPGCVICGNVEHLSNVDGKNVCQSCCDRISKLARKE